jgi:hypothetical protein
VLAARAALPPISSDGDSLNVYHVSTEHAGGICKGYVPSATRILKSGPTKPFETRAESDEVIHPRQFPERILESCTAHCRFLRFVAG